MAASPNACACTAATETLAVGLASHSETGKRPPNTPATRLAMANAHRCRQTEPMVVHYRAPGWLTRNVFNRAVAFLTRHGMSILGSRVLAVRGRSSGAWRTTPVNLLDHDGRRYLVSARGHGQWVRNLRVAGTGELRLGKRAETFTARELTDDEKLPVLRAYLRRWKVEVGAFFKGVGPDSSDEQIRAIAPDHPTFEVLPTS
jgi:deazaflavin-dependent oxidoreductase (nitroreductase family)